MKFEDLNRWDIDLIKDIAGQHLLNENIGPTEAMIKSVLVCIHAKGFNIVKDETREATWSTPKPSWYTQAPRHNNWWKK